MSIQEVDRPPRPDVPVALDHLVWAVPDLDRAAADFERWFGVRPAPGGSHPAWGTRNRILPLGARRYLEIIGPDPAGAIPPRVFGIGSLTERRLVTWAAAASGLEEPVSRARSVGLDLGVVLAGARTRDDGSILRWRLTDPLQDRLGGVLPFLIDWAGSAHPGAPSTAGLTLLDLRASHPDPGVARQALDALGLGLRVDAGPAPALAATFRSGTRILRLQ